MLDDDTRFEFLYASVRSLLSLAYRVNAPNVRGPDWIDSDAIDVIARKPLHTTDEEQRLMLQSLLADRFQLVVHRDSYALTVYDLRIAQSGPKLRLADRTPEIAPPEMRWKGPARSVKGVFSMNGLAAALQHPLETSVIDATGLTDTFEILLQWSPEDAIAAELPGAIFPPLEKAIKEQLGLVLQSRKIKVDTLVVDSGKRIPAGN